MSRHSRIHPYVNWAKERLDEMDAALAAFEAKTGHVQAAYQAKSERMIADLKKKRDAFRSAIKQWAETDQASWRSAKADLESQWNGFAELVEAYVDGANWEIDQQEAAFRSIAQAQVKAWNDAAASLRKQAADIAAANRAEVDAAIKRMQADAADAQAAIETMKRAGAESWSAFGRALATSRKAFDRANEKAAEALERAAG